jgi:hypothetical protein
VKRTRETATSTNGTSAMCRTFNAHNGKLHTWGCRFCPSLGKSTTPASAETGQQKRPGGNRDGSSSCGNTALAASATSAASSRRRTSTARRGTTRSSDTPARPLKAIRGMNVTSTADSRNAPCRGTGHRTAATRSSRSTTPTLPTLVGQRCRRRPGTHYDGAHDHEGAIIPGGTRA